jgi:hypothetical protein
MTISGNKNCDIRNMHWLEIDASGNSSLDENSLYYKTKDNKSKKRRLITTGLNGMIIEWDLVTK